MHHQSPEPSEHRLPGHSSRAQSASRSHLTHIHRNEPHSTAYVSPQPAKKSVYFRDFKIRTTDANRPRPLAIEAPSISGAAGATWAITTCAAENKAIATPRVYSA